MNKKAIDISVSISPELVTWPESVGFSSKTVLEIAGEIEANVSSIEMDVHCGTHIDAPLHFLKNGKSIESIGLEKLIGECFVKDCGTIDVVDETIINSLPKGVKKVLFKTKNSMLWANEKHSFHDKFVALNVTGAAKLAELDIDLVGVDYLSIQGFYEHNDTHRVLLKSEVVLLEAINLTEVNEGWYDLYCLPLKLTKLEAAPCRAVLIKK